LFWSIETASEDNPLIVIPPELLLAMLFDMEIDALATVKIEILKPLLVAMTWSITPFAVSVELFVGGK